MKNESGIDAELDPKGKIGELTVWVGETLVEKKEGMIFFPDKEKVLAAVQAELKK